MNVDCISPTACTDQTPLTAALTAKPDSSKPESIFAAPSATDTVSISDAAKAALEESKEAASLTAQEAMYGGRFPANHL